MRSGIFFHDLFEHLDFASGSPDDHETLVANKLKAYGFGSQWQAPVVSMINRVLSVFIERAGSETFTLRSIPCKDRINEMAFYFPLNPISPRQLAQVFHAHTANAVSGFPERIESLTFPVSRGFMKGYIDLVFRHKGRYYLIDWKSNLLGTRIDDYNSAMLIQVMSREYYFLQYHLYTLALHQYLRLRLPGYRYETDFGGVVYMFIRGIDPDQSHAFGIYKDRPNPQLVHALGETLIPGYERNLK